MNILFLSAWFPHPADNGSKLRIQNVLRQLAKEHRVTLLSMSAEPKQDARRVGPLLQFCRKVHIVPATSPDPAAPAGVLASVPRLLESAYSAEMEAMLRRELKSGHYDLLVAAELRTLLYAVRAGDIPALLEDAEPRLYQGYCTSIGGGLGRLLSGLARLRFGAYLRQHARGLSWTVASDVEGATLQALVPNARRISVIPNGLVVKRYLQEYGEPEPDSLIFPGALTSAANLDAMRYFVEEIWPFVRKKRPRAQLRITGSYKGLAPDALPAAKGVQFTGYLSDIRPAIARSAVCVVPARSGGSSQMKVLEALALGTPVVATTKGAEGLEVTPEEHILVADDPEAFAGRVVELLRSARRRERLAAQGRALVRAKYDWQAIGRRLRAAALDAAQGKA